MAVSPRPARCIATVLAAAFVLAGSLAFVSGAYAGFSPFPKQLSEPLASVSEPADAVDAAGNTFAVWQQNSTHAASTQQIAGRRVAADGSLGPLLVLSAAGSPGLSPVVAAAPSGSFFVAWRSGFPNSVLGRWIAPDGTLGPLLTILTGSATEDGVSVRVVVDASGTATVGWYNEAAAAKNRIEVRRVSPEGALGAQVNSLVSATTTMGMAALPGGDTFIVSESRTEVIAANGLMSLPIDASVAGNVSTSEVGIAFDPQGEGLLAWRRGNGPPDAIAARRINAAGVPVGGELLLEGETPNFIGAAQHVAVDSSADFLVGWSVKDGINEGHAYARAVRPDGSLPGPRQAVSGITSAVPEPTLTLDDRGDGVAAFEFLAGDAATLVLLGQTLAADATPLGEPAPVSSGNPSRGFSIAGEAVSGVSSIVWSGPTGAKLQAMLGRFMEPPTCAGSQATVVLGRPLAVPIACSGIGVDGATVLTAPKHGAVGAFGSAPDGFLYTPAPGYQGADSFVYAGSNDGGLSGPATVSIAVNAAPAAAVAAPVLASFSESNRRWRAGGALASIARRGRRPPLGTTFVFTLNEQATAHLVFAQAASGRKVHGKCVARTKRNAHARSCRRTLTRGALALSAHAGTDRVRFQGRLSRTARLAPGTYTVSLFALNAAGQRSATRQLTFTIVR